MTIIINNTEKEIDLSCFVGDNYKFVFIDHIPKNEKRLFSTYEIFDINKEIDDEIIYYEGNKLDIILNNFIWYSRFSDKEYTCVVNDRSKDLHYFKNFRTFNLICLK